MSECCGINRTSKFCPDCGAPIFASPVDQLLNHCRKMVRQQSATAVKLAEQSEDRGYKEDHRARFLKRSDNYMKRAETWKLWADGLQRLIDNSVDNHE